MLVTNRDIVLYRQICKVKLVLGGSHSQDTRRQMGKGIFNSNISLRIIILSPFTGVRPRP